LTSSSLARLNIITTVTLIFLFSFILLGTSGYTASHEDALFFQAVAMYFLLFNGTSPITLYLGCAKS
jgi:hypothetical protein